MGVFRKTKAEPTDEEVRLHSAIAEHCDSTRINCLEPRSSVEIVGVVQHVAKVSVDGTPGFEIEVSDGTGSIVAQWTGRSSIACIDRGRRIAIWGRAAPLRRESCLVVYNPRYELLP
jgi:hypothetical protein